MKLTRENCDHGEFVVVKGKRVYADHVVSVLFEQEQSNLIVTSYVWICTTKLNPLLNT